MLAFLKGLLGKPAVTQGARLRLSAAAWPAVVYAIGDVHGTYANLIELEKAIVEDAAAYDGERWLVMLGDYIDRGRDSARVVSHLLSQPPLGFRRITLAGNHEQMLLDFVSDPVSASRWLDFGGGETARSYGLRYAPARRSPSALRTIARDLQLVIPEPHLEFLRTLPVSLSLPGVHFVHAGVQAGKTFDAQSDDDLMWTRMDPGTEPRLPLLTIVHGHTPGPKPVVAPGHICVDTGAYATGVLTAVRLVSGSEPGFLASSRPPDS